MKNSIGIALSFDETKIKKTTEYLAVCCRALRKDLTLHEFIYVLDSVPSTKGIDVAQKIMSCLKYDGVDNIRLFGLTSDGASSCLGNQKGVSTIVSKQHSPEDNIPIIHCYVHRLNLVLKSLSNDDNHNYFTSITDYLIGVCILISKDIHHVGMKADFKNYLKSLNTKIKMIPQYCSTRWSVVANILDYVVEHLNILQDYFESTEYSHYIYALTFFKKDLVFISDLFNRINSLIVDFQKALVTIPYCFIRIKELIVELERLESNFSSIYSNEHFKRFSTYQNNITEDDKSGFQNILQKTIGLLKWRFSSFSRTDTFKESELIEKHYIVDEDVSKEYREKYQLENDIDMVLHVFDNSVPIESFNEKYRDEIRSLRNKDQQAKYLYYCDLNILASQKRVFETVCKLATTFGTTVDCEKTFSIVKAFNEKMPNAHVRTISNRVSMRNEIHEKGLKDILRSWIPYEE